MLRAEDLKIGDEVVTDSQSNCASGGYGGKIIKIDDDFIYTDIGGKYEKAFLTDVICENYFLAWKRTKTE
jgi:preprotein translocase subunit YajC